MITVEEVGDMHPAEAAARLLDKGLKGTVPASDKIYGALLSRYASDPKIDELMHAIADARGFVVHDVNLAYGLQVTATKDSEWAMAPSRISYWATANVQQRAVMLAAFMYIPAAFYPTYRELDDFSYVPAPRNNDDIVRGLVKLCEVEAARDSSADDDGFGPQAIWRTILAMPEVDIHERKKKVHKVDTISDAVRKAVGILADNGYLKSLDDERFYPTRRFQMQMRADGVAAFYAYARTLSGSEA